MSKIKNIIGNSTIKNPLSMPLSAREHESGWHEIIQENGHTIDDSSDGGFSKDSAEYIAHCVNSHEALVSALYQIKKSLEANPSCDSEYLFKCCSNANEIAHNAIYSAENYQKK